MPVGKPLARKTQNFVGFAQVIIKLQRCNIPIPLNWSLSAAARADHQESPGRPHEVERSGMHGPYRQTLSRRT